MFGIKKRSTDPEQVDNPVLVLNYKQTNHIPRGSKRIKLTSHGNAAAESGIRFYEKHDTSGFPLIAKVFEGPHPRVEIELDGVLIGTIWKHSYEEYYNWFATGNIDEVFSKIEDQSAYIFVKPKK